MNQIRIDGTRMTIDALDALLSQIEALGGPTFGLSAEWVVESPDPLALYALEKLLKLNHNGEHVVVEPPIGEKYHGSESWVSAPGPVLVPVCAQDHAEVAAAVRPTKEIKAWRVLDADGQVLEQLTITERNFKLAKGEFADGTILHHPRAGKHKVTGAGPGQGMEPA